ncbi:MAG: ferritin-like domain-containing protein [Oscillatoriales cyanobacterium RM2_1_1]|nr:ferritin-like domain-containing protein [Oscillatoriales cyanobacterium SM2_3_0]NJO47585.1 ferritin-like domain-containing protein [Oscillatoriales cyanobacterium RM2_1_1]
MNLLTQLLHIVGNGASAYIMARGMRDPQTRPNLLAGFQMAESGSVPFLETLRDRALAEADPWMAEQLTRHAADERRHGQIFAQALKRHHKQAIDPAILAAEAQKNPDRQRNPFFDAYFKGYSQAELKGEAIDWVVFIGSTHILELDASRDFVRMAHALPEDNEAALSTRKAMLSIAQDETRHAAYLKEALYRRLPAFEANQVIDEWRGRKVNALIAMTQNFIQRQGQMQSLAQDAMPTDADSQNELPLLQAA